MLGLDVLIAFLLGGFSVLALEFTVFDYVILQPIRDLMQPIALALEPFLQFG